MNTQFAITIGSYGTMHAAPENEIPGINILRFNIETPDAPVVIRKPRLSDFPVDHSPAIPLCFMDDDPMPMKEHQALMIPNNGFEGIFAVAEHLGEGQRCIERFVDAPGKAYHNESRGQLLLPINTGLTNLERIIYDEAGMTAQGEPVLPHTVRSTRPWFKYAGGIRKKFGCTIEEAETLLMAFDVLELKAEHFEVRKFKTKRGTDKQIRNLSMWIETMQESPEKFQAGYRYFQEIGKQMVLVTDEGEPRIVTTTLEEPEDEDQEISADNPAEIADVTAEGYHKLDDPRDTAPLWEDKQPKEFRKLLAQIRGTTDLKALKIIGKSLFNRKDFTKTQASVLWDNYRNRKHRLEPKLRPIATKILGRLADPDANLAKAAYWLNGEGKTTLTTHELSVVWAAWKKVRQAKVPNTKKQQADLDLSAPDITEYPTDLAMAEEPSYLYD